MTTLNLFLTTTLDNNASQFLTTMLANNSGNDARQQQSPRTDEDAAP
jgi:hypothetical protein